MAPSRSSIDRLMKSLSTTWEENREQFQIIDFFHVCEHFYGALATAWGTRRARAQFPIWRDVLRDCTDGVAVIVSLLRKLRRSFPRRTKIRRTLGYFVRNRRRMQYAATRARGLSIASGADGEGRRSGITGMKAPLARVDATPIDKQRASRARARVRRRRLRRRRVDRPDRRRRWGWR
jgi:hypothetical protein